MTQTTDRFYCVTCGDRLPSEAPYCWKHKEEPTPMTTTKTTRPQATFEDLMELDGIIRAMLTIPEQLTKLEAIKLLPIINLGDGTWLPLEPNQTIMWVTQAEMDKMGEAPADCKTTVHIHILDLLNDALDKIDG